MAFLGGGFVSVGKMNAMLTIIRNVTVAPMVIRILNKDTGNPYRDDSFEESGDFYNKSIALPPLPQGWNIAIISTHPTGASPYFMTGKIHRFDGVDLSATEVIFTETDEKDLVWQINAIEYDYMQPDTNFLQLQFKYTYWENGDRNITIVAYNAFAGRDVIVLPMDGAEVEENNIGGLEQLFHHIEIGRRDVITPLPLFTSGLPICFDAYTLNVRFKRRNQQITGYDTAKASNASAVNSTITDGNETRIYLARDDATIGGLNSDKSKSLSINGLSRFGDTHSYNSAGIHGKYDFCLYEEAKLVSFGAEIGIDNMSVNSIEMLYEAIKKRDYQFKIDLFSPPEASNIGYPLVYHDGVQPDQQWGATEKISNRGLVFSDHSTVPDAFKDSTFYVTTLL